MKSVEIKINEIFEEITKEKMLLPHMQRDFVWKESQIQTFLDSLLRKYPIGIFLFWVTHDKVFARRLFKTYNKKEAIDYSKDFKNYTGRHKYIILDGQQRIQSLYLSMIGELNNKELYFDFSSSPETQLSNKDDKTIYNFKFIKKGTKRIPENYVKIKEIFKILAKEKEINQRNIEDIISKISNKVNGWEEVDSNVPPGTIRENIFSLYNNLIQYSLSYYKVDDHSKQEEVLNIFIRINHGGTQLKFSDLIFSYFKTNWKAVEQNFSDLIQEINKNSSNFKIDNTFLIKTLMTLMKNDCSFKLSLLDQEFVNNVKNNWLRIKDAFQKAYDALNKIFIYNNTTLSSNISIIPIIYGYYYKKLDQDSEKAIKQYVYISIIKNVWSSKPEENVNIIIKLIEKNGIFDHVKILNKIVGKNIKIIDDDLISKSSKKNYKLILNLLYFKHENLVFKRSKDNKLDVDHIFPESHCKEYFSDDPSEYNNILNYCYLTVEKNRKSKMTCTPKSYFESSKNNTATETYEKHSIPPKKLFDYNVSRKDKTFVENFRSFKDERKKLILKNINEELAK